MRSRDRYEPDGWSQSGRKITSPESLAAIAAALVNGPIIVEQWKYRGASGPERRMFDDEEDFTQWLNQEAYAGDSIYVWAYSDVCRDDNTIASGKCPDDQGEVPARGAY